ncbi:hypothetical protein CP967_18140 [Streptomyces nitrosporeus]|uniref:HNH endonuclease n=1 Tax=Streptomyces nitrosporeus TaxID=28894 RepID=A0A5J6FFC5_9ACTN|nr:hypothetical protein [Streptomyces nitrosporeus]QEU73655.1 hypothetical protein CP967_18140 [Streptomyces nitrosporeus]GGZ12241.1 hypothetical protein GCM10010327_49040 [Streptomyces nitrosporeus]
MEAPLPSWLDPGLGTMKRAALWLVSEVGVGKTFTKEQLRAAFPGVSQVDRRMRDLRDFGWRIDTNREDATLDSHEQRFVEQGDPVWLPGRATRRAGTAAIGAGRRREVLARDGNMCRSCGITPGELYDGTDEAAQLDIARREVIKPGGGRTTELVTECRRCRVGGRALMADLGEVIRAAAALSSSDRRVLEGWLADDQREFTALDRLWSAYRSLPEESRAKLRSQLGAA